MKTKKNMLILVTVGLLLLVGAFLIWFFNRSFDVTFNNLDTAYVVKVKYNNQIPNSKISTKEEMGKDFLGWYEVTYDKDNNEVIAEETFNFDSKITKDINLIAKYHLNENDKNVTITFNSNGGTKVNSITIKKGTNLKLPKNPTRSGYAFVRWEDKNAKAVGDNTIINSNITLKAVWKALYTCSEGYTLSGTKCNKTTDALTRCPDNTKSYKGTCVLVTNLSRTDPEYTCGSKTVNVGYGHTQSFKGELFKFGTNFCFYGVVTDSYEQENSTNCTNRGHKWNSKNNKCYYDRDDANVNITSTCTDPNTIYIESPLNSFGSTLNGGCYPVKSKEYYCNEGSLSSNKCQITIDAIKID